MSAWGTTQEATILKQLLKEFQKSHPDIHVNLLHVPDNYWQKLHLLIAGDMAPDVMMVNSPGFPVYAEHDLFLDLSPYLDPPPKVLPPIPYRLDAVEKEASEKEANDNATTDDVASNRDTLKPNSDTPKSDLRRTEYYQQALTAFTWEGRLLALPRDISNLVVFYNRNLFRKAGLRDPRPTWSWDRFVKTASLLTQKTPSGKVFGVSFYASPPLFWLPFVWSAGGDLFSRDMSECTLDRPEALNALKFYADLRHRWHVAPTRAESGDAVMTQLFLQQRVGMMISGRWSVPVLREQAKFDWDVVPLPVGPTGQSRVGIDGSGYSISAKTKSPDAAWELTRFMASRHSIQKFAASGLIVPARPDVAEHGLFPQPGLRPEHAEAFLSVIPSGMPTRTPPRWNEFSEVLILALEPVWEGTESPEHALKEVIPQLNKMLPGTPSVSRLAPDTISPLPARKRARGAKR